ncbi:MAG: hypothetical protein M3Z85_10675 [Acidobacteriota bacterium]|nr:hypothetical protein [Acidobacteriota bacterium]
MLNMTRRAWLLLGWAIVLFTIVDGVILSIDTPYQQYHSSDKPQDDKERAFGPVLTIVLEGLAGTEEFIDAHEKLLVVLSTIAIAAFTYTLWRSTSGLQKLAAKQAVDMMNSIKIARESADTAKNTVEIMERTAEQELRAHVFLHSGSIGNVANPLPSYRNIQNPNHAGLNYPDTGPITTLFIRNCGKTPAFGVIHWTDAIFREYPIVGNLPRRTKSVSGLASSNELGPDMSSTKVVVMQAPLTDIQIDQLRAGRHAIYIYGGIYYKDVFRKRHKTNYFFVHIARAGAIGISTDLTGYSKGNKAT